MSRKDDLLKSFLNHDLLESKYELDKSNLPKTVREALNSEIAIVKAISLIVDGLDGTSPVTDSVLRNQVTQFLNEAL
jgi:hypothetical protein